jgi:predicted transcriptional regulator
MNGNARILRIGIASREEIEARSMAIARGEYRPCADEPKVWFTSIESLAQVLSSKNQLLLELIARSKPASMAELAKLSGRQPSNLSRTLNTMERYGLVRIRREGTRRIPEALYDRIDFSLMHDAMIASRALNASKLQVVAN